MTYHVTALTNDQARLLAQFTQQFRHLSLPSKPSNLGHYTMSDLETATREEDCTCSFMRYGVPQKGIIEPTGVS